MSAPVRVLIVDDSAVMRQLLSTLLSADPEIEVVGTAPDPHVARERIKSLNPDVITLDVEMPHMDGVTFLRKIMTLRPTPVVMISTLTQAGAEITLEALEIGAVDFVAKPTSDLANAMAGLATELQTKVKGAARARVGMRRPARRLRHARNRERSHRAPGKIVVIGASTGGVEALKVVLMGLPPDCPPTLITQHMPPRFTSAFAERLNRECPMTVSQAVHDEVIMSPATSTSLPVRTTSNSIAAAVATYADCPTLRRSPAIARRSMCCFVRPRARSENRPSASFLPEWERTVPRACSKCARPERRRLARTKRRR